MAKYEHLPLFKKAYDFNLYFAKLSKGLPKDFKYGLATEVRELSLSIIDNIILANNSLEKSEFLKKILVVIERIKIKVRLLKDLNAISLKSYKFIFEKLVDISKQTNAWLKWSSDTNSDAHYASPSA
jgi:hypothetical protein